MRCVICGKMHSLTRVNYFGIQFICCDEHEVKIIIAGRLHQEDELLELDETDVEISLPTTFEGAT